MDLEAWLRNLGLEQYARVFHSHDIDADVLPDLTETDLERLGMSLGHRKKLLRAIAALEAPQQPEWLRVAELKPRHTEAERRHLTILFCDLVGSTALSSQLDPEDMRDVIQQYQQIASERITRFEGHVAKYMGDGILAYFGWPRAHEDDAERAVRAGLELVTSIGNLLAPDGSKLACRIGVATGSVVIGDFVGDGAAQEEAVVGETPNLAARLQALAAPGQIIIASATRRLLSGLFELDDLGRCELKGFAMPIPAWRVLGESATTSRFAAHLAGSPTPLVGREQELELLCDRWAQAKAGAGQLALISGEPGIGKSRLTQAFQDRLAQEPTTCLVCQCSPFHEQSVLHPVTTQLTRMADLGPNDPPEVKLDKLELLLARARELAADAAPLLAGLLSLPIDHRYPPLNLSPQRQKEATLRVLVEYIGKLTSLQPMLMVVEDIHWADPTTMELLDRVIQRLPKLRLLAVFTFRPQFVPPWAWSERTISMILDRLSPPERRELVAQITGGRSLPAQVLEQIVAKTDGIPLFVEELTKAAVEAGVDTPASDRAWLSAPAFVLPDTLQDSLMARLDRLPAVTETAQVAAVIGREFSFVQLVAVAQRDEGDLQSALSRLVDAELVYARGQPPDATYTFKHALVRDAAYATLLRVRRQQLHTRVAQVLEEQFTDIAEREPETVAQHYEAAGLVMQAIVYWQRAGERATERSANEEAENHLRRALNLIERLSAGAERQRMELHALTVLGRVLTAKSGYGSPEVEKVYSRAHRLCETVDEESTAFPVLLGLTIYSAVRADLIKGLSLSNRLLNLAERANNPELLVEAHFAAGITHHWRGDLTKARQHLAAATRNYQAGQHRVHLALYGQDPGPISLCRGAAVLWLLGYSDQANAQMRDALVLVDQLSHPFSKAYVLSWAAWLQILQGDIAEAERWTDRALRFAREQEYPYWISFVTLQKGWLLAQQGDAQRAITRLNEGLAQIRAAGTRVTEAYARGVLGEALARVGQVPEGVKLIDQALTDVRQHHEGWCEAELLRLRSRVLLAANPDAPGAAEISLRLAIEKAQEQSAKAWELRAATSLARLWAEQDHCVEARDLLGSVYDWFSEGFDTADLKDARHLLDTLA